jgi:2-amino-4-hydroxy-6-hydroxymethyldihydropteridine diphosphokinase
VLAAAVRSAGRRRAYLSLGGNVGDVAAAMRRAASILTREGDVNIAAVSGLYATPPWGVTDQPEFLNCCIGVDTTLSPEALLDRCLATELELKRVRTQRWGPRTIDIDVLWMDGETRDSESLKLPHPRIAERAFVLAPLADIAPRLEIGGKTVADLLAAFDREGIRLLEPGAGWLERA